MKRLRANIDLNDVLIVLGLILLAIGLGMVSWALSAGVMGGLLLAIGLVGALRKGAKGAK